jgi:hypothetical protein
MNTEYEESSNYGMQIKKLKSKILANKSKDNSSDNSSSPHDKRVNNAILEEVKEEASGSDINLVGHSESFK